VEHTAAAAGNATAAAAFLPPSADAGPTVTDTARPSGELPQRPGRLTLRLESQHRPMTAVIPWPAPANDDNEFDAGELLTVDAEYHAPDAATQELALRDDASSGPAVTPLKETPAAASDAPARTEMETVATQVVTDPIEQVLDTDPGEHAPEGRRAPIPRADDALRRRDRRDRRGGAHPNGAAEVDAVNRAIENVPQVRSGRELILLVHRHLREARSRRPPRLVLAGTLGHAAQASRAVVHTALFTMSREPCRHALLLPVSPHHQCAERAHAPLVRHAADCGFAVSGHDVLGQADASEPLYRSDLRETAMQQSLAAALRDAQAALAMLDSADLSPMHAALAVDLEVACVALVQPVGLDEHRRAGRLASLLRLPNALVLRPSPELEWKPWCTARFVERVCRDSMKTDGELVQISGGIRCTERTNLHGIDSAATQNPQAAPNTVHPCRNHLLLPPRKLDLIQPTLAPSGASSSDFSAR
jgi:hypothetical protein